MQQERRSVQHCLHANISALPRAPAQQSSARPSAAACGAPRAPRCWPALPQPQQSGCCDTSRGPEARGSPSAACCTAPTAAAAAVPLATPGLLGALGLENVLAGGPLGCPCSHPAAGSLAGSPWLLAGDTKGCLALCACWRWPPALAQRPGSRRAATTLLGAQSTCAPQVGLHLEWVAPPPCTACRCPHARPCMRLCRWRDVPAAAQLSPAPRHLLKLKPLLPPPPPGGTTPSLPSCPSGMRLQSTHPSHIVWGGSPTSSAAMTLQCGSAFGWAWGGRVNK